jgi:hypothetical protein
MRIDHGSKFLSSVWIAKSTSCIVGKNDSKDVVSNYLNRQPVYRLLCVSADPPDPVPYMLHLGLSVRFGYDGSLGSTERESRALNRGIHVSGEANMGLLGDTLHL